MSPKSRAYKIRSDFENQFSVFSYLLQNIFYEYCTGVIEEIRREQTDVYLSTHRNIIEIKKYTCEYSMWLTKNL